MAISTALDIAARALLAQQAGLAVVGNNIANVDTPGYTRQVPIFEEDQTVQIGDGATSGDGVRILNVSQVLDPLLERRRTQALTDKGEQATRRDQLSELVGVENDLQSPSLASAVSDFFDAADGLALRPASLVDRQLLLGRAATLSDALNQRSGAIADVQRGADDRIVQLVGNVNTALDAIARTNLGIVHAEVSGQHANDLLDQRATALNDLATTLGVNVVVDQSGSIRVAGDSGIGLVDGGTVIHRLTLQDGAVGLDGRVLHDVTFTGTNGVVISAPDSLKRGTLSALFQVRDGDIVTASDNLDTFAAGVRDAVNVVQTAGVDLDGVPTGATPLFGGAGVAHAARDLTVAIADPRQVAAALPTELAASGNGNARALAALRITPIVALGSTTATGYLAGEVGRLGEATANATDAATAAGKFADHLDAERASVSGVNLNEELTNLLRYQHAFQASAQVISVVNTTLDDLVHLL